MAKEEKESGGLGKVIGTTAKIALKVGAAYLIFKGAQKVSEEFSQRQNSAGAEYIPDGRGGWIRIK